MKVYSNGVNTAVAYGNAWSRTPYVYCGGGESIQTSPSVGGADVHTGFCSRPATKQPPKAAGDPPCDQKTPNPINLATGNKFLHENDYNFSSTTSLDIDRSYNSFSVGASTFIGNSWTLAYDYSLVIDDANWVNLYRPDGKLFQFKPQAADYVSDDADIKDRLLELKDGNGMRTGWQYTQHSNDQVETYDATGKILNLSKKDGQTLSFTYSDTNTSTTIAPIAGLLIEITDNLGRKIKLTHEDDSSVTPIVRVKTIVNPQGGIYTYAYDANQNLTSVTYPDGKVRTYHYELANLEGFVPYLTGITDENNSRYITWLYDTTPGSSTKGEAIGSELAGGVMKRTIVGPTNRAVSSFTLTVRDSRNEEKVYTMGTFAGMKRTTSQSQPAGSGCAASASALTYDANGNVATRTDFNGNKTTYDYDMSRNLETRRTEGLAPDDASDLATRTITTSWHAVWRLPLIISEYSGKVSTGTPLKRTTYVYDDNGNITSYTVEDPLRGLSRTTTTSYVYSTAVPGLVLEKTVDGPLAGSNDITRYFYYPHDANCADSTADPIVDPITGVAPPNLGCRGQLSHVIEKSGFGVVYSRYNHHGQVEEWTDSNQVIYTNSYDLRQRLIRSTVENEQTQYSYDDAGLLKKTTFPDGSELNYTYDPAHRLREISNAMGDKVVYTLDDEGNRTNEEMFDSSGTLTKSITRSFDALNRAYMVTGE